MTWTTLSSLAVALLAASAAAQSSSGGSQYGTVCAQEGGTCDCNLFVRYGTGNTWTQPQIAPGGSVQCTNSIFGDIAPNQVKECRCGDSGTFGVSVTVYPSTRSDWISRPICGTRYNDQCCNCTLSPNHDLCSNATGCSVNGHGGTAAGYTCAGCPCKNPGVGCMLPRCYSTPVATVTTTGPSDCARVGDLDVYVKGGCSASANATLTPHCPLPQEYVSATTYPGTSSSNYVNFCNYVAAPACASQFCTSQYSTQCQQQCITAGATGPDQAFHMVSSTSPVQYTASPVTAAPASSPTVRPRYTRGPTPPPGPPAPSQACQVVGGGLCITDGAGYYGDNDQCQFTVTRSTHLQVQTFQTEVNYDFLNVSIRTTSGSPRFITHSYSGTVGPSNLYVPAGSTITWRSDRYIRQQGFYICAQPQTTINTTGLAQGDLNFYSSSTCSASSRITEVALRANDHPSGCAYGPFQDNGMYPVRIQCGAPAVTPPPPGTCSPPGVTPCSGRGTCNATSGTCVCNPGYTDRNCTTLSCLYNCAGYHRQGTPPPPPRGTCVLPSTPGDPPVCNCMAGFTGTGCQSTQSTLAQAINRTSTLSALWNVLQLPQVASILSSLSNAEGNITLFAPTNTAFSNLPTNVARWLTSSAGTSALQQILQYHVVQNLPPGNQYPATMTKSTLLSGSQLTLTQTPATVFEVISSRPRGACATTTYSSGGTTYQCFTDGRGRYGNNERCTIQVLSSVRLSTPDGFQTEAGYDNLTIGRSVFSGTNGPSGRYVSTGTNITWESDVGLTFQGFTVCASSTPTVPSITTNTQEVIGVEPCTSYYCRYGTANGYLQQIDSVMIPQAVLSQLPTSHPTHAVMTHPPSLPPTPRVCHMQCDPATTYCSSNGLQCHCLPNYVPQSGSSTTCQYQGTPIPTTVTTTTLNATQENNLLQAALRHAITIQCGSTVRGNTTGGIDALGGNSPDMLYRFYASSVTPQPVWFSTCDEITGFDTYIRVYHQARDAVTNQYRFVEIASNDDDHTCNISHGSARAGRSSNVSLALQPGTYYVLVEGWSTQSGTFALHTNCGGPPAPPPNSAPLKCVRSQSTSNGVPYGPFYYRYQICCLPGAVGCNTRTACPIGYGCNPHVGCLPSYCSCSGTSTSSCSTDTCMNTTKYGLCGTPATPAPTSSPTFSPCQGGTNGCSAFSTTCGVPPSGQPTCYCKDGFVNLRSNTVGGNTYSYCQRAPSTTTMTTTTTTENTMLELQQAYRSATTITCGNNYSATQGGTSIIGGRGGDRFFKLYVSSRSTQPVTLTTCNPHTTFDTTITVYRQALDAASSQYRYSRVATNNNMYPRCPDTNYASLVSQTLSPGWYLVNVDSYTPTSTSSNATFTLAVLCGAGHAPTPPPTPAPPAPLGCTQATPSSPWIYDYCTISQYPGSSLRIPCSSSTSVCTRVSNMSCIPKTCACNQITGAVHGCQENQATCLSTSYYGICLPSTPPPTTPAPTFAHCPSSAPTPACNPLTTYCGVVPSSPTSPGSGGPTCICLPGFMRNLDAPDSATNCVPVPTTVQSTTTTTTLPVGNMDIRGTPVSCGSQKMVTTAMSTYSFYITTVDENTPQPVTFSVCGAQPMSTGLRVYALSQNISTGSPELDLFSQSSDPAAPCFVQTPGGPEVPGFNNTVSLFLPYGSFYVPIPSSALGMSGYLYRVLCQEVTPDNQPSHGGKGWNSLSKGDQNTVVVACVAIIAIGGVIAGAIFVIKRYQSKTAYTAAMLAKDMDQGDDDALLQLGGAGGAAVNGDASANYEDEFEQQEWKPETYGQE